MRARNAVSVPNIPRRTSTTTVAAKHAETSAAAHSAIVRSGTRSNMNAVATLPIAITTQRHHDRHELHVENGGDDAAGAAVAREQADLERLAQVRGRRHRVHGAAGELRDDHVAEARRACPARHQIDRARVADRRDHLDADEHEEPPADRAQVIEDRRRRRRSTRHDDAADAEDDRHPRHPLEPVRCAFFRDRRDRGQRADDLAHARSSMRESRALPPHRSAERAHCVATALHVFPYTMQSRCQGKARNAWNFQNAPCASARCVAAARSRPRDSRVTA